jgi:hypothetical protein
MNVASVLAAELVLLFPSRSLERRENQLWSFSTQDLFIRLGGCRGAIPVGHREPEISVEFSEAVIPVAGPVRVF